MTQTTNTSALKIMAALEARIDQEAEDRARKEVAGLNRTILDGLDKLGLMTVSPHAFVCRAHEVRKQHLVDELTHQAISNLMPVAGVPDATPTRPLVEMKIVVDAQEAVARIKEVLRDECGAELIKPGELLALDPDPRLDEIVGLLKQLVTHAEMSGRSGGRDIKCRVGTMAPHGGLEPGGA